MPTWSELTKQLEGIRDASAFNKWALDSFNEWLGKLSAKRGNRNVILYSSGFLQKPHLAQFLLQISHEDINGFMTVMQGLEWERGLTLVLHTPGGITNAAESLVDYLLQKFPDIEVIVPTFAMSAGTMICLAANRVFMGRQSQLGPIDAQIPIGGRYVSARAIVDQFESAKLEITTDIKNAAVWAPILQHLGPALLKEAQDALAYGEEMVCRWLEKRAFAQHPDPKGKAAIVAAYFNRGDKDSGHKSHGRRIDREEARRQDLEVHDLEPDQELQDIVLTIYHLLTVVFEKSPATKLLYNQKGRCWIKNGP